MTTDKLLKVAHNCRVVQGNSADFLPKLEDESIDMIMTSPPYDKIRDYKGFEVDLNAMGKEFVRLLVDGGVAVVVIQDQTINCRKTRTTNKLVESWCEDAGLHLWETCIYLKNGRPGAWWNTRLRIDHEFILIFFKGDKPKYFTKDHLTKTVDREWKATSSDRMTDGSFTECSQQTGNTKTQGTTFFYSTSSRESGRGGRDKKLKNEHPATYPNQLPADFIEMFCPVGGIVLDPFMGSGTTGVACVRTGRKFLGVDISREYCLLALERIKIAVEIKTDTKERELW